MSPLRLSLPLLAVLAGLACSGSNELGPSLSRSDIKADRGLPLKKFALILGNSLPYGLQPGKDVFDPTAFSTGFGTLFVQRLNALRRRDHVTEVNLACPGETTETFINGVCLFTRFGVPLHTVYQGSQLEAAEEFLRRHRGQVNPVILSVGVNDLNIPYLIDCESDEACLVARIPAAVQSLTDNYELILTRLRALASRVTLLILVEYRLPGYPQSFNDGVLQLLARVRAAGQKHGAILVESDPIMQANPCAMLFVCRDIPDIHPTDAGHRALTDALWAASGFAE